MHPAVEQIRQYLQLIALQFVQHPEQAELRVAESPQGDAVRFRLILEKTDVARIIGRNGMTASAIRSLAKAAGEKNGIKVIKPSIEGIELSYDPTLLMTEDLSLFGSQRTEILDRFEPLMGDKAAAE